MKLRALDAVIRWNAERRRFRMTLLELQSMGREELDDFDLSSAQLTSIARRAAYGARNGQERGAEATGHMTPT